MPAITTQELSNQLKGTLIGAGDLSLTGVEQLDLAQPGQLTFIGAEKYAKAWPESKASAALVAASLTVEPGVGRALIQVPDADLAMAQALELFAPPKVMPALGTHPDAIVDPTAKLGKNVAIGPGCIVGANVTIGDGCILHANVTVMDESHIGPMTELYPGVVIRERCTLGARCILHPNVVIGADGFGYRPAPGGKGIIKIPQIGTVVIGNDVEIGAGCTIDRGKFSATSVGDQTKIDNLVQIAHNCRIGRGCIIVAQTGIAGSVTIGDGTVLGGQCAINDHVTIGSGTQIAATAAVMSDVPSGVIWGGYPARDLREALREHAAVRKLPELLKQIRQFLKSPMATERMKDSSSS